MAKDTHRQFEFRCPVHGFIWLNDWERGIISHPAFQRLRRIRQLGWTGYVCEGAMHSRFEHSLGVMHIVTLLYESADGAGGEHGRRNSARDHFRLVFHTSESPTADDLAHYDRLNHFLGDLVAAEKSQSPHQLACWVRDVKPHFSVGEVEARVHTLHALGLLQSLTQSPPATDADWNRSAPRSRSRLADGSL